MPLNLGIGDMIGIAFQGFRELSESGVWKGGVVASGGFRAGAAALGR